MGSYFCGDNKNHTVTVIDDCKYNRCGKHEHIRLNDLDLIKFKSNQFQ